MSDNVEHLKEQAMHGKNAEDFLNDSVLTQETTILRAELFRTFCKTGHTQDDERKEVWRQMRTLDKIERRLVKAVRNGRTAERTLAQRIKDKVYPSRVATL